MTKKFRFLLLSCFLLAGNVLFPKEDVRFYFPAGLPSLTLAKLAPEAVSDRGVLTFPIAGKTVACTLTALPDELMTHLLKQTPDLAVVPSNMAALLYERTKAYKILGGVGWGSFYILGTLGAGTWSDLKGRQIYAMGKGLTPDITFRLILKENGLDPDGDFQLTYFSNAEEIVAAWLARQKNDKEIKPCLLLPEPAVTNLLSKNSRLPLKILFDLNDEWKKMTGDSAGYPQSTLVVKESFYLENKDFVKAFAGILAEADGSLTVFSAETIRNRMESFYAAAALPNPFRQFDADSVKRSNIRFVKGPEVRAPYKLYFEKLGAWDPTTLGGTLPDEKIFLDDGE
ncbi:MAG: hypothetical protein LBQ96_02250 [Fusobacteriaceae bacterium]|jgi:NitT/TauT family transport system substrate-binding protein|nr:hypothetical protein [Fusobacteriaceae bacterium]